MSNDDAFDEVLRDRFRDLGARHTPEPADPGTIADRILARDIAGSSDGSRSTGSAATTPARAMPWKLLGGLIVAALAGVGVGIWAGSAGSGSTGINGSVVTGGLPTTQIWRCPDVGEVGHLTSGDRILLTGRNDDGSWARLRDPRDLETSVWVSSAAVDADHDISSLPVVECDDPTANPDVLALGTTIGSTLTPEAEQAGDAESDLDDGPDGSPVEPTTTIVPESTTITTDPGPDPGPRPTPPAPTPDRPDGPSTTTVPDRTGPTITSTSLTPSEIWTMNDANALCGPDKATRTTARVGASDPSGIRSISGTWKVAGESGPVIFTRSGSTWSGSIGDFRTDLLPPNGPGTTQNVEVTITAVDGVGNPTRTVRTFLLHANATCFG